MNIFIDTEIWSLAQKKPIRKKYSDKNEYKIALDIHMKAKEFIHNAIARNKVYMSYHQINELYHVLGFRGSRLPISHVNELISTILKAKKIIKVPLSLAHIVKSIELSTKSGIHIWDFLCVVPIAEYIDRAYSIDKHFQDPIFKELGIHTENPLGYWMEI